jgi:phage terminase large subunit-like protein
MREHKAAGSGAWSPYCWVRRSIFQLSAGFPSRLAFVYKALELFDRWKADGIVAETNYGGAMVESNIRTARKTAPVKMVTASRGKIQRAEPVAALYEQGKVRHVGQFPELERQYCHFSTAGYVGKRSPDHADTAIWGITDLMLDHDPQPNIRLFNIPPHLARW